MVVFTGLVIGLKMICVVGYVIAGGIAWLIVLYSSIWMLLLIVFVVFCWLDCFIIGYLVFGYDWLGCVFVIACVAFLVFCVCDFVVIVLFWVIMVVYIVV